MNKEHSRIMPYVPGASVPPPGIPLADYLHSHGMRLTPQKTAVFHLLRRRNNHPTAEMIFAAIRKLYPMTSLGTVYQILEQFSEIGLARKISLAGQRKRFDGKLEPHAHFVCERCGRIEDIEDRFVHAFKKRFAQKFDFRIHNHYFEFTGLCASCVGRARRRKRLA